MSFILESSVQGRLDAESYKSKNVKLILNWTKAIQSTSLYRSEVHLIMILTDERLIIATLKAMRQN